MSLSVANKEGKGKRETSENKTEKIDLHTFWAMMAK